VSVRPRCAMPMPQCSSTRRATTAAASAGSRLLPDEVPIIARRGELVVPTERVVREEKTAREHRPITVVVNVTAADASSFRASQGQIAADMARAIDRARWNR
jgi:hypothetical protein